MPCLTIYELDDLTALTSEAYQKHDQSMPEEFKGHLRFERSVFQEIESYPVKPEQSEGRAIFHVVTEVESGFEDEFDRWYAREHVPAVLTAPGVLSARRYLQVDDPAGKTPQPERYTCLAVYELDDAGVLTRPEAVRASRTASCPADLEPHRRVTHHVYEPFFSLPKD
jgi:hypothetical protein